MFRFRGVDARVLLELIRIGLPIGLTLGFEAGLFSATAILMGTLGTVPLAAHQIAIQKCEFHLYGTARIGVGDRGQGRAGGRAARPRRGCSRRVGSGLR